MNDQTQPEEYAALPRADDPQTQAMHAISHALSLDVNLWRLRFAAALNTVAMAMEHGGERDWTDAHVESVLAILETSNRHVAEIQGVVPAGFGEIPRTRQAAMMLEAAKKMAAPK